MFDCNFAVESGCESLISCLFSTFSMHNSQFLLLSLRFVCQDGLDREVGVSTVLLEGHRNK